MYKHLANVLANQLKKTVGKVVSIYQQSFIDDGRHILDAGLIANEILDSKLKSTNSEIICELDIEKGI